MITKYFSIYLMQIIALGSAGFAETLPLTSSRCADILLNTNLESLSEKATSELTSYLSELFQGGVITRAELERFHSNFKEGRLINPIENPELDIARYLAAERITDFLERDLHSSMVLDGLDSILHTEHVHENVREEVLQDVSGIAFLVKTGNRDELLDLLGTYFSKAESVVREDLLRILIERVLVDIRSSKVSKLWIAERISDIFVMEHWSKNIDLLRFVIEHSGEYIHAFFKPLGLKERTTENRELLDFVVDKIVKMPLPEGYASKIIYWEFFISSILSKPHWIGEHDLIENIFSISKQDSPRYFEYVWQKAFFEAPGSEQYLELFLTVLNNGPDWTQMVKVVVQEGWGSHPEFLLRALSMHFFPKDLSRLGERLGREWNSHPRYLEIRRATEIQNIFLRRAYIASLLDPLFGEPIIQITHPEIRKLFPRRSFFNKLWFRLRMYFMAIKEPVLVSQP